MTTTDPRTDATAEPTNDPRAGLRLDSGGETCDLPIEGMSCASCAARIEKALNGRPGVTAATVNFASKRATVTYDPHALHRGDLTATVTELGYSVPDVEAVDPEAGELRDLRPRLWVSIALTVPLLLISMVPNLQFHD